MHRTSTASTSMTSSQTARRTRTAQSRPTTARSRPATARIQTATSVHHESSYIVALLEGRGVSREVGIAALDKETGRLVLVQLADGQTYVKTLHQLHLHNPSLVIIPDTFLSAGDAAKPASSASLLVQYLEEEFPDIPIERVARKYWNSDMGLDTITQLCIDDEDRPAVLASTSSKYYVLCAVCALFKFVEFRLNIRYAAGSLLIRYVQVQGTMMIHSESARNLELVGNALHKRSTHSLFGLLDHTFTAMASRLLRVNILAPITVQAAVDARLDVVAGSIPHTLMTTCLEELIITELVQTEDKYTDIRDALKPLNKMDFDKLIASLAAFETRETSTAKTAATRVAQILNLRSIIRSLPLLQRATDNSRSQLLQFIHEMISDKRLAKLDRLVEEVLNKEAVTSKSGSGTVNARVYAVKANCNRLLDVARETYQENVGDIHQLHRALSEKHNLPLMLVRQESGFVFALKKDDLDGDLPKGFINVVGQKGRWVFTSMELKKMNARMKDALDETLMLSDKTIQDLVSEILVDVGALYKASEAVATLDMLWAFAHVSIMRNYIRPEFTGTLAIKAGRHPVLELALPTGTVVPNDTFCDDSSLFQIVQGPNMSGKSTYLRQIGLLTIMAMCGCFVPAEYASFRVYDSLLTRLSNDDDMEKNLSTFANEITTTAMILGLASSESLILIDELGRGTSPREGVGISHAIAEELISLKSSVFFATHFSELATTLAHKPSVVNLHLSVQKTHQSNSCFDIVYPYKIMDGIPEDMGHYGLELARLADLPQDVVAEAKRVASFLTDLEARQLRESRSNKIALRRRALLRLHTQLTQVYENSTLPEEELKELLLRIRRDFVHMLNQATVKWTTFLISRCL